MHVHNPKALLTGVMFALVGSGFALVAPRYSLGTAAEMGAGYFPAMLGIVLTLIGIVVAAKALVGAQGEVTGLPEIHWAPTLIVMASIVFFAVGLRPLGLVVTTIGCVLIARLATRPRLSLNAVVTAVCITIFTVAVFRSGLDLPLPIWPTFDTR